MLTLPIDCLERCPYQKNGYCTKAECKATNGYFSSYNLCPYASVDILQMQKAQNSFNASKIPRTGIKFSV